MSYPDAIIGDVIKYLEMVMARTGDSPTIPSLPPCVVLYPTRSEISQF